MPLTGRRKAFHALLLENRPLLPTPCRSTRSYVHVLTSTRDIVAAPRRTAASAVRLCKIRTRVKTITGGNDQGSQKVASPLHPLCMSDGDPLRFLFSRISRTNPSEGFGTRCALVLVPRPGGGAGKLFPRTGSLVRDLRSAHVGDVFGLVAHILQGKETYSSPSLSSSLSNGGQHERGHHLGSFTKSSRASRSMIPARVSSWPGAPSSRGQTRVY